MTIAGVPPKPWTNGQQFTSGGTIYEYYDPPGVWRPLSSEGGGGGGGITSVNSDTGPNVVLDADEISDVSTDNKWFTSDERAKLAGIEAGANVTDAQNVAAAGALMASDVLDEDDMASNSATKPPSQQSVVQYVDAFAGETDAVIPMVTPADPQPGDTRWNIFADPPELGGGTDYTDSDTYLKMKSVLTAGPNVTLTPNDGTEKIGISATASSGGSGGGRTWLNAANYGLSTSNTWQANTTALQNCIAAAVAGQYAVYIPRGTYEVGNKCLNPPLGSNANGLVFFGDGDSISILQMTRNGGPSFFLDNSAGGLEPPGSPNGLTARHFRYIDIGFQGGPVDTSAQRSDTNENCFGFRLYGASDQNFRFTRCRFQTMAGVWWSWGHNNASEISWEACKIKHISQWVVRSQNLQALNYFFWNCDVEIVWGKMFWITDPYDSQNSGGGHFGVFGGSWIIQRDGSSRGTVIKVDYPCTGVISFYNTRFEIRDDAMVFDGSAGNYLCTVNFDGCNLTTIASSGGVRTFEIRGNQFVGITRSTFEHNGSYQTYNVQDDGWLVFRECAVRGSLASEVTTGPNATTRAILCRERFNQSNVIEFQE